MYRYFGKSKQPYKLKLCLYCNTENWIVRTGKFCSSLCAARYRAENKSWHKQHKIKSPSKTVHKWLNEHFKKKGICSICSKQIRTDWAYIYGKVRLICSYVELCRSCHQIYDRNRLPVLP